jgi:hypothetical protein
MRDAGETVISPEGLTVVWKNDGAFSTGYDGIRSDTYCSLALTCSLSSDSKLLSRKIPPSPIIRLSADTVYNLIHFITAALIAARQLLRRPRGG